MAVPTFFEGVDFAAVAPLTVLIRIGDEPATIEISRYGLSVHDGALGV